MDHRGLSAYVPRYVENRCAVDGEAPDAPRCSPLSAAILFADISGFTPLTEKYEGQGRLGLERLTEILNDYFARTIRLVTACDGDIEAISGDGIVAFWEVSPGRDLASCVRLAADCSRRLHEAVRQTRSEEGAVLRLRAALVCGDVFAVETGGQADRWHFLLSGPPLFQITATLGLAGPGETALSPAAVALLGPDALVPGKPIHAGQSARQGIDAPPRVPSGAALGEALIRFVPRRLARLPELAGQAFLAEFRRVSVCFVRLTGLVCNTPEDLPRVQKAIVRAEDIVYRYGGVVQGLTMNDKGSLLMVVFGLPGSAHEDDPVRAVLSMRELLTALDELWLDCTCGVTTGVAYCGPIGSDERRTYTVIGRAVNLAASLIDIRGSRIVCDAETARAAGHSIDFETLPASEGKGLSRDTKLYRPSTRRTRAAGGRALIGRGSELQALLSGLDRNLSAGERALILIEGEPGIGKSTILLAMIRAARERGFDVFSGSSDAIDRSTPFRAWREPFRTLLGIAPGADGAASLRHLADWASRHPDFEQLVPLFGGVLATPIPDTGLTRHMQGAVRAQNTIGVMVRALADAAARRPTLVVLDDVHWLDPSSLEMLERLTEEVPGLLVCLASRTGDASSDQTGLDALIARPGARRIRLEGLAEDAIGAVIARRIGAATTPRALLEFVTERAGRNPYYSEEIAAALLDSGRIGVEDGSCVINGSLADLTADTFPDSIETVVTSRVELLTPSEQHTVKVASVQGREVAYDMLCGVRLLGPGEAGLPDQIGELTRREILLTGRTAPSLHYIFKHLITQQVVYNQLLYAQRRELHQAVAEWIERHHAGEIASYDALLGAHWSQAERHDEAADCYERAGERSLRGGTDNETIDLLERALASIRRRDGARDKLREARILRQLGDAYLRRGRLAESERVLQRALRRLREPWPATTGAVSLKLAAELLRQLKRRKVSGLVTGSTARDTELSYVYGLLCSIYYFLNKGPQLLLATACAVNTGEHSSDKAHLAETYILFGNVMGILGLHGAARRYMQLSAECNLAEASQAHRMHANELRSLYLASTAGLSSAEALLRDMLAAAELIGDQRHRSDALSLLGIVTLFKGEATTSRQFRDSFLDKAMRSNDSQLQCWAWIERAEHELHCGDLDNAISSFAAASALIGKVGSTEKVWLEGQLARAHLLRGDSVAARDAALRGLESLAVNPTGFYALEGCAGVADVFLSLAAGGAAYKADRRRAARAVRKLGRFARSFPIGGPRHLLWRGRLKALGGDARGGATLMRKAANEARRLALPVELALADLHLGLMAQGEERHARLQAAAAGFETTGARLMAARARDALSGT